MAWIDRYNLMEYYHMHMRPFRALLANLERRGILVATNYLADVEVQARKDQVIHVSTFKRWAAGEIGPDGLAMNLASSVQLSTFLLGGGLECQDAGVHGGGEGVQDSAGGCARRGHGGVSGEGRGAEGAEGS
mmetsp:Transcript_22107/g.33612  ORF Transcript_22107/g.33612 Transcript_22107/m.33612 type:complete len:132 (-) Transcript_22107:199-594(-)